jgi:formylglycine-generating enzyme required for sulfatase activity
MVLVEGNFCPDVEQTCSRWLDDEKLPFARCGDYSGARCKGERKPMRFCIDKYEYTPPGESLPMNYASFKIASSVCKKQGKRVCGEVEWTFACEGEEMKPYPYGFSRKPICNYDKSDLYEMKDGKQVLKDLRARSGSHEDCVSPFGVYDMAGNVDESTRREHAHEAKFNNALKGGWWMAARNRCRPATTAHDDYYKDIQVGVRCCKDAPAANASG